MENFRQIVTFLNGYKIRNIDILGNDDSTSRFTEFYNLIKTEKIKTDEEAAQYFYGENVKPSDARYRDFKSRFKEKILNTLLFIDTNHERMYDFERVLYRCTREWTSIEILFKLNIFYAAIPLAERLVTTCVKYEITDLTVRILERLKSIYATQIGDKKKYKEYKERFWHYKAVLDAEYIAKEAYHDLRIDHVNTTAYRAENVQKAKETYDRLKPLMEKFDSFGFLHFIFTIECTIYHSQRDYETVLKTCEKAILTFENKPFKLENAIAVYKNLKVIALLMLRRYEDCKIAISDSLKFQTLGNFNWFRTMESKMLLGFHTQAYTEGYETYLYVSSIKQFNYLKGHSAETWQIFQAYLYFCYSIGKLNIVTTDSKNAIISFRFKKFLNQVPTWSHDKKGLNIPILTIQIVLMITEKMYDQLINRIETIEKYLMRYVPKNDVSSYRTNQFIKMLLEIPKSGFNRIILERRTRELMADITKVPYNMVDAGYKMEVIPYEILWAELLQLFGNKTVKVSKPNEK